MQPSQMPQSPQQMAYQILKPFAPYILAGAVTIAASLIGIIRRYYSGQAEEPPKKVAKQMAAVQNAVENANKAKDPLQAAVQIDNATKKLEQKITDIKPLNEEIDTARADELKPSQVMQNTLQPQIPAQAFVLQHKPKAVMQRPLSKKPPFQPLRREITLTAVALPSLEKSVQIATATLAQKPQQQPAVMRPSVLIKKPKTAPEIRAKIAVLNEQIKQLKHKSATTPAADRYTIRECASQIAALEYDVKRLEKQIAVLLPPPKPAVRLPQKK